MARHEIHYRPRGATVFKNVRKGAKGRPHIVMDDGEQLDLVLDLTDYLDSGETISTATVSNSGVTSTIALASPKATLTISSPRTYGEITVTLTMSSGAILKPLIIVTRRPTTETTDYAA